MNNIQLCNRIKRIYMDYYYNQLGELIATKVGRYLFQNTMKYLERI